MWDRERASDYNKLAWVKDPDYARLLLEVCDPRSTDTAVDVGTGTGYVASILAPFCAQVLGVDSDPQMLEIASREATDTNITYRLFDITKDSPPEGIDLAVFRMVLHHVEQPLEALMACANALRAGGRMVVAEGIPAEGTEYWYARMFKMKEKRRTYTLGDLVQQLHGFVRVDRVEIYTQRDMSINNWLRNSATKMAAQLVRCMHIDTPQWIKTAYNMRLQPDGDILMDWRTAIVGGVKK